MNRIKNFGFKTVNINGLNVYTCNIAIASNVCPELQPHPSIVSYKTDKLFGKNKKVKEVIMIKYAVSDAKHASELQKYVMAILEQSALTRVQRKYAIMRGELVDQEFACDVSEVDADDDWNFEM